MKTISSIQVWTGAETARFSMAAALAIDQYNLANMDDSSFFFFHHQKYLPVRAKIAAMKIEEKARILMIVN